MGLRTQLYETIYDLLTNASLGSGTASVKAAFPNDPNVSFPLVVINPINVDKEGFTFNRSYNTDYVNIDIDIWTKKNKDKDVIADEIDAIDGLKNVSGYLLVGWTESNAVETNTDNKLHLKTIRLTYIK